MSFKIDVPFSEKEQVKSLGARWDAENKTWYVSDNLNINLFKNWLPSQEITLIAKNPIYIGLNKQNCWKCKKDTPVISLGCKSFKVEELNDDDELIWELNTDFSFFDYVEYIPNEIKNIVVDKFPFYKQAFSKTVKSTYWINHCIHCSSIQGDHFLHNEPDRAFFPTDVQSARVLTLLRMNLKYDAGLICGYSYCTANELILKYSPKMAIESYLP